MTDWKSFFNIKRFKQGDNEAFEYLHKHSYRSLVSFACKIVRNETEAEDIVAETFLKLFVRKSKFVDINHIASWLYVTTHNAAIDANRSAGRRKAVRSELAYLLEDQEVIPELGRINEDVIEEIHEQIDLLPPQVREVFKKLYFKGKNPQQIADELHISINTVYVDKGEALKRLRPIFRK